MSDDRDLRVMLEQLQAELRRIEARLAETGRHSRQFYDSLHTQVAELTAKRDALLKERNELAALPTPGALAKAGRVIAKLAIRGAIAIAFAAPFLIATACLWPGLVGHTVDLGRFFLAGGFAAIGAVGLWWAGIHNPLTRRLS